MSFLESHIKQFVECKLEPKIPGCELILKPTKIESVNNFDNLDHPISVHSHNWPYPRKHYV